MALAQAEIDARIPDTPEDRYRLIMALAGVQLDETVTVREALRQYLRRCARKGLRESTIHTLELRLYALLAPYADEPLATITIHELEDYVFGKKHAPGTVNGVITIIKGFFNFCERRNWLLHNPARGLEKVKQDEAEIKILTPAEAEGAFNVYRPRNRGMALSLALKLFAGCRHSEVFNLGPGDFEPVERLLRIKATAKSRRQRLVQLEDNAWEWAKWAGFKTGERKEYDRCFQRGNIGDRALGPSVTRHSYASYYYALYRNVNYLKANLGHVDDKLIFNHYRALATKKVAEEYFSIYPWSVAETCIL